jgi:hypothetical protein
MKHLFKAFIFILPFGLMAQQGPNVQPEKIVDGTRYANTIDKKELRYLLTNLSSDEMAGRELGTKGNTDAAIFIANHFKNLGLTEVVDDYFQKIPFNTSKTDATLKINNQDYKHLKDFLCMPNSNNELPFFKAEEIVFVGYGIDDEKYSDYRGKDVNGKVVLMYKGEPKNENGISHITGTEEESSWSTDPSKKAMAAKNLGVKSMLYIEDEIMKQIGRYRRFLVGPSLKLGEAGQAEELPFANNFVISSTIAKEAIGKKISKVIKARDKINAKGKPKSFSIKSNVEMAITRDAKTIYHENVLGFIEGTDPDLKDEVVIVTAHYDHVGQRGEDVFNGADDDGSGTVAVMEIAEALKDAQRAGDGPRRSVLCMLVTGEEKGLLGSKYYTENPIFPLEKTVANVNIDMIGRVDPKHEEKDAYIYVIGSDYMSDELHEINETVNSKYTKLDLDYTYNAKDDPNRFFYRSDHFNFAVKGIPAIFYFNGTHADYHRPSDTIEKIDFDQLAKRAKLAFYTTWELANRDARINVDRKLDMSR